jgi:hypothetical protein
MEIGKVRKADVDLLYRAMKAAGYAGSTLRGVHAVLRDLFTEAEDNELIKASPMAKVTGRRWGTSAPPTSPGPRPTRWWPRWPTTRCCWTS